MRVPYTHVPKPYILYWPVAIFMPYKDTTWHCACCLNYVRLYIHGERQGSHIRGSIRYFSLFPAVWCPLTVWVYWSANYNDRGGEIKARQCNIMVYDDTAGVTHITCKWGTSIGYLVRGVGKPIHSELHTDKSPQNAVLNKHNFSPVENAFLLYYRDQGSNPLSWLAIFYIFLRSSTPVNSPSHKVSWHQAVIETPTGLIVRHTRRCLRIVRHTKRGLVRCQEVPIEMPTRA